MGTMDWSVLAGIGTGSGLLWKKVMNI